MADPWFTGRNYEKCFSRWVSHILQAFWEHFDLHKHCKHAHEQTKCTRGVGENKMVEWRHAVVSSKVQLYGLSPTWSYFRVLGFISLRGIGANRCRNNFLFTPRYMYFLFCFALRASSEWEKRGTKNVKGNAVKLATRRGHPNLSIAQLDMYRSVFSTRWILNL